MNPHLTPMQANRFGKRHNRLDNVKTIATKEFFEGVGSGLFVQEKTFTSVNHTLKYDEDRGGVFVWSNLCSQYFLVGKDTKLRNS